MIRLHLTVIVSVGLILPAAVPIRTCEVDGLKTFENRCEGTRVRTNKLEDLALLGLDGHFDEFARDANLTVKFFLPGVDEAAANTTVVEAVELHDHFHYFMHSKDIAWKTASWNEFKPWPSSAVIDRLPLNSANLGVLASYQSGREPVYVPAYVYGSPGNETRRAYTFHIRSGQEFQQLDISVLNASGEEMTINKPNLSCNKERDLNCIFYAAGSSHSFTLDMSALVEGEYR